MHAMDWSRLLCTTRIGSAMRRSVLERPDFQRDGDKITFCAPFRRLQGKLQVHARTLDFARNRMTHSLECSRVGRALGRRLGDFLGASGQLPEGRFPQDFADVVEAACLAHDIGTPPAAHLGEDTIRQWFEGDIGSALIEGLGVGERSDFLLWEGNAQGYRFLTRETGENGGPGLGLTMATVAATVKYPCTSDLVDPAKGIHRKKFNAFQDDAEMLVAMAGEMGLVRLADTGYARHPLSYLVEAADDICYSIVDLEDAWRLGCLSDHEVLSLYEAVSVTARASKGGRLHLKCARADTPLERISCMRGVAISVLVDAAFEAFVANYESIMVGSYANELLADTNVHGARLPNALRKIKLVSVEKIYASRNVCADTQRIVGGLAEFLDIVGSELLAFERAPRRKARASVVRMRYPRIFDTSLDRYRRLLRMTDALTCLSEDGLLDEVELLGSAIRKPITRAPARIGSVTGEHA